MPAMSHHIKNIIKVIKIIKKESTLAQIFEKCITGNEKVTRGENTFDSKKESVNEEVG